MEVPFSGLSNQLRYCVQEYIEKTPNLPEELKPEILQLLTTYVNFVPQIMGIYEVQWRRWKDE